VAGNAIFRRQNDRSSIRSQKRIRFPNGSIAPVSSVPHGVFSSPEKALVEFVGLGDVEDAQDRDDAGELNGHQGSLPFIRSLGCIRHCRACPGQARPGRPATNRAPVTMVAANARPLLDLREPRNWGNLLAPQR
jgi:hypothetical protein